MVYQNQYNNLLERYNALELKAEGFSSAKQELIMMRDHLDKELERYKRLQYYSGKALNAAADEELMHIFTEAFIDVLEVENAIVLIRNLSIPATVKIISEGFRLNGDRRKFHDEVLALHYKGNTDKFEVLTEAELSEFKILSNLSKALTFRFRDSSLLYEACFVVGVSSIHEKLYPDFDQLHISLFKIISNHLQIILANKIRNNKIKEQYQEILISQERLMESESRFKDIVFSIADWVWEVDSNGKYTYSSNKSADILGYSAYEIIGKTPFDFMPESEVRRVRPIFDLLLERREPIVDFINWNKAKDGRLVCVLTNAVPMFDKDNYFIGYRGVDKDITEIKNKENDITKAIIKTQEDERFEISAELHDNVLQILAANSIALNILEKSAASYQRELLSISLKQNSLAIDEIRNLSHRISPVANKGNSIKESFYELIQMMHLSNEIDYVVEIDKSISGDIISVELETNIYRIAQEQLKNILKYAKASLIRFELKIVEKKISFSIGDNGIGFDIKKIRPGIGFANIKRRVEFFAGTVEISSSPGKGCTLAISIPLEKTIS